MRSLRSHVSCFLLALFITSMLTAALKIQPVNASGTIYIRADGSVEGTTSILTADSVTYVFTDNIFDSTVVVEKNDIVVDGAGYTLQGTMHIHESTIGINMSGRTNVTVRNTQIRTFSVGIFLSGSSNNTLSGNNMTYCRCGITLSSSTGNSIGGNNITGNDFYRGGSYGIYLDSSSYNSISGNYVANSSICGISVVGSSNYNSLSANNMTENVFGIILGSSNNSVSGNMFAGDGLGVGGLYSNSVENNTVNGKPLVYLTDVKDYSVGEAGQVILVNCDNIKVENLDLSSTSSGVELLGTNNTIISGNNMTANFYGIFLWRSSNNSLSGNNLASCESCIHLDGSFGNYICENNITVSTNGITLSTSSNHNIISENTIANNQDGIWLGDASYNSVTRNNITANSGEGIFLDGASNNSVSVNNLVDNDFGIYLYLAFDNIICHNNFENARQVIAESEYLYANVWDDGYPSGGNYWSDYNGTDLDPDGIGDTEYAIGANNTDHYPLMGMFNSYTVTYYTPPIVPHACNVTVISNSTISDFDAGIWLIYPEVMRALWFNVNGAEGSNGFCRVSFPTAMMNGTYHVFLNGTEIPYTLLPCSDANTNYLYFNYTHSTQEVIIIAEFPLFLILPLFFTATLLAILSCRRKRF